MTMRSGNPQVLLPDMQRQGRPTSAYQAGEVLVHAGFRGPCDLVQQGTRNPKLEVRQIIRVEVVKIDADSLEQRAS